MTRSAELTILFQISAAWGQPLEAGSNLILWLQER